MRVQILNLNFCVKNGLKLNQELKPNVVGLRKLLIKEQHNFIANC